MDNNGFRAKIAIDYQPQQKRLLARCGRTVTVNLAHAIEQPNAIGALVARHSKLKAGGVALITSSRRLTRSVTSYLTQGYSLSYREWVSMREQWANLVAGLWSLDTIDWEPPSAPVYAARHRNAVRYGNVELRVIENFLYQPTALLDGAAAIAAEAVRGTFAPQPQRADGSRWLSAGDVRFNIQALMTNAGFYFPAKPGAGADAIAEWCALYFDELLSSSIFEYPGAHLFFFPTLQKMFERKPEELIQLSFPQAFEFYDIIKDKKLLIISPFAKKINELYRSGGLFSLYKNKRLPHFYVKAINAPMSVFPRRPGRSWRDSFDQTCELIAREVTKSTYDLFTASAGCYGLPLCGFARKEQNLSTLYYGNHINTLFGILQKCSKDFMSDARNASVWRDGGLAESFPELNDIDQGRYV